MYVSVGVFKAQAHQPIWFSLPEVLFDTNDVPVGPKATAEIATYTSVTVHRGRRVLWYPDRKYYLLGRVIRDDWVRGLADSVEA